MPRFEADQYRFVLQRFAPPARAGKIILERGIPVARFQAAPALLEAPLAQQEVGEVEAGQRVVRVQCQRHAIAAFRIGLQLAAGLQHAKVRPGRGRFRHQFECRAKGGVGLFEALLSGEQCAEVEVDLPAVRSAGDRPAVVQLRVVRVSRAIKQASARSGARSIASRKQASARPASPAAMWRLPSKKSFSAVFSFFDMVRRNRPARRRL